MPTGTSVPWTGRCGLSGCRSPLWWAAVLSLAALAGCETDDSSSIGTREDPDGGQVAPADASGADQGEALDMALAEDGAVAEDGGAPMPVEVEPCVQTVVLGDLEIFAYEASRVDATADAAGFDESGGLCSRPGVLPWTGLTWPDANRVCMAHGFRLCSNDEWQAACQGADRMWSFPYAAAHEAARCNDHVSGSGAVEPTGARENCRTPEGIYDMSGNVWELTVDGAKRGASWKLNAVMFHIDAARCDNFYDLNEGFADDDLGFRCCR